MPLALIMPVSFDYRVGHRVRAKLSDDARLILGHRLFIRRVTSALPRTRPWHRPAERVHADERGRTRRSRRRAAPPRPPAGSGPLPRSRDDPARARARCASGPGAIAPVIGSRSLNATRNGLSHAASRRQAARLAAEAGSSGVVGTSSGIAARRGSIGRVRERRLVGGQDLRRQRRPAPGVDQPGNVELGRGTHGLPEAGQTSGIGWSPVGRPVLVATTRANRSGVLRHQP